MLSVDALSNKESSNLLTIGLSRSIWQIPLLSYRVKKVEIAMTSRVLSVAFVARKAHE